MTTAAKRGLVAGPLVAILMLVGTVILACLDPGYSQLRQTISEIGQVGSPLRVTFAVLIFCAGICELILAVSVRAVARQQHRSQATTYLIALSALWSFGVAIFPYPEPLHEVFGYVGLVAMLAPIVFAMTWRRVPAARSLVRVSWVLGLVMWASIIVFAVLVAPESTPPQFGGVLQRAFLYSWAAWCGAAGSLLRGMIS